MHAVRSFPPLTAFLLCAAALYAAAVGASSGFAQAPRGIVVFLADDHGHGDLGCYGNQGIRTPHIDRLAAEGMLFERAFLNISSCSPSRASLLTGLYPHNTGAEDLHQPLPADRVTFARRLRERGWYTAALGKWHLGEAEKANWDCVVECPSAELGERTLAVLRDRPEERPFFLWVASRDPHRPFEEGLVDPPHTAEQVRVPPYLPDHPAIRSELALYYDHIARFDSQVGTILAQVDRHPELRRDTLVLYLSDNGMPFPRAKTTLYDAGIATPLLVRWPAVVKPESRCKALVSGVDLAPTLLHAAGHPPETPLPGRTFLPALRGEPYEGASAVFAEANWHDFEHFTRAVRTERYKLIRHYYHDTPLWNSVDSIHSPTWKALLELREAGSLTEAQALLFRDPRPFEELYDLTADPHELRNVIDDPAHAAARAELGILLENWRVETADRMPKERTPDGWTRAGLPLPHNQPWYDRWQGNPEIFQVK